MLALLALVVACSGCLTFEAIADPIPQRYLELDHDACMVSCGKQGAPEEWCKRNCDCSTKRESETVTLDEYLSFIEDQAQGKLLPRPLLDRLTKNALDCVAEVKKSWTGSATSTVTTPSTDSATLQDALTEHYGVPISKQVAGGDQELASCVGKAMAEDIPQDDQSAILRAIQTKQLTPETKALMEKWLGGASVHGPLRKPDINDPSTYVNGQLTYGDGTTELATDEAGNKRIMRNMHGMCPQYDALMKPR
jgi:hypothetical protein